MTSSIRTISYRIGFSPPKGIAQIVMKGGLIAHSKEKGAKYTLNSKEKDIITKLQKKTKEWMQLERKTLEQRRQADEFYEMNLMELIEKDYIRRNKEKVFEAVDYMVISVGTSYEPIVLNICLFKPKRILFLYTNQSVSILDKVVHHCRLEQVSYEKSRISETSPWRFTAR